MHRRQLIGLAIVFVLQNAAPSFHANAGEGEPMDPSPCEVNLSPQNEVKKIPEAQLRVSVLHELNVKGDKWLSWQPATGGRALLAILNGRHFLSVFEPAVGQNPIFESAAKDGSKFTGAAWSAVAPSELVAGDDKGNLWRFDVLTGEASVPEFQGSAVDVVPVSIGNSLALGLGNLARVRIMPVGSVDPGFDLSAVGPILDMKLHRTSQGRTLAAIAGNGVVEVFDLDYPGRPLFSHSVSGVVKPQWIVDDSGESVLVFLNAGVLTVTFPLSDRPAIVHEGRGRSDLQMLRTQNGEVLILLSSPGNPTEILSLQQNMFSIRAVIEHAAPGQGLIESPNGEIFVAYMSSLRRVNSRMHIARLSDVNAPIFTLTFEGEETVKNLFSTALSGNRHLLAVGTSANVYILELNQ